MGDLVPEGTTLQADATAEILPGQIVAVVLEAGGPFRELSGMLETNGSLGVIKLYLGKTATAAGRTVFLLGQLNPPVVFAVPSASLLAMHSITATVSEAPRMDGVPEDAKAILSAQLDLLSPFFCQSEATAPVGPDWRPVDLDALVQNTNLEQVDE
ncbi:MULTISPECIES: hypothetical protein [unclassified Rhizobium]|uniref:hypothetical protein n=1 Tax=unclassified Rhizobium TaxID=2613769 RepID=UPI0017C33E72|nr:MULTISPECIES: hypothetical protein [unclassified Rhizobium]MBB3288750.1 hypothetical protein [Rhizobium sp. BK252]MBB3403492.1 hypothetical protein [Rhizobium sp. BK289]MBB3416323.1 hypothetical protein [Rhizobium sp. BK284]MBB3483955.1 hypothetical protein [Rhizobium sp. BK347]